MHDLIQGKLRLLERSGVTLTVECSHERWTVSHPGEGTIFGSASLQALNAFLAEYVVATMV